MEIVTDGKLSLGTSLFVLFILDEEETLRLFRQCICSDPGPIQGFGVKQFFGLIT